MMKKISSLFLVALAVGVALFSGCSKREQVLAGTSIISAAAGGMSFLKGHCERNGNRKVAMTHYKYHGSKYSSGYRKFSK